MSPEHPTYERFLSRLKSYERMEPFPKSRGMEKLSGVRHLVAALGHPERAFKVVHVAGTNGKGMTAAMVARLLLRAGHRVGLYTSPHVQDIRERIALDGDPISETDFARSGHRVLDLADTLRDSIHFSYFDLLTVIAFLAFRQAGVAWAVLETGLGGLSDATNVTDKELCVLTRIGLDHMHILGNTLQEIATQKLGIVRSGVPTVVGEQDPELTPWLLARLAERESPVLQASDFRFILRPGAPESLEVVWPDGMHLQLGANSGGVVLSGPRLACAANALAAAEVLWGDRPEDERSGRLHTVLSTHLSGRLELRRNQGVKGVAGTFLRRVVLDGGHNAEAMRALVTQLGRWGIANYTLLLSLQVDKLVEAMRPPIADLVGQAARLLALTPKTARAAPVEALTAFVAGLPGFDGVPLSLEWMPGPQAALLAAAQTPEQPLVVAGSFWTLGDVMALLEPAPPGRPCAGM